MVAKQDNRGPVRTLGDAVDGGDGVLYVAELAGLSGPIPPSSLSNGQLPYSRVGDIHGCGHTYFQSENKELRD